MINLIEARTPTGDLLTLTLGDDSPGILVTNIDGLDPVAASVQTSSYAVAPGAKFQSSRQDTRNIVLTMTLDPDYLTSSVRQLRRQIYAFFMPTFEVSLRFYTDDGLIVETSGVVETCEAPLSTDTPKATVSIICFNPFFADSTATVFSGSTVSTSATSVLENDGDVATGFSFALNVNRDISAFTIYNKGPDGTVTSLDFSASLHSGDTLTIDTNVGSKAVTLTRSGVNSSLLYAMSSQSTWLALSPGDNHIRVYATGAAIDYSISYTNKYGGL
jgi:hypothetical protein